MGGTTLLLFLSGETNKEISLPRSTIRMSDSEVAIEALENLGLTEYEARCFVALTQLPHGTAKEIGQVADIPRSRVYETMERLQGKGLVELHDAEPRQYQSVEVDTAIQVLRKEYESYFDTAEQRLNQLEPAYKEATPGVWAINTHDQVTGRAVNLLDEATDEIVLVVLDEGLLCEETLDSLRAARDRGVSVNIGTVSESVRERIEEAEIDATVFSTELIEWMESMSGSPRVGRIVMTDRTPVLVSALHDEELPGVPNETAVWTDEINHGFATFTKRVLTFEMEDAIDQVENE